MLHIAAHLILIILPAILILWYASKSILTYFCMCMQMHYAHNKNATGLLECPYSNACATNAISSGKQWAYVDRSVDMS
jgi:hypothetical protein